MLKTLHVKLFLLDSLLFRLLITILEPGVGVAADAFSLPWAFIDMAGILEVLISVLLIFWGQLPGRKKRS